MGPELIRLTSSPKGFNHVHNDYYVNKIGPIVKATSFDNPTLSKRYLESLKTTYSPKLYRQEVLAERLNLAVGAVYDEFSRDKQVQKCAHLLSPSDQLYFFTDYNISNYCGVYMFHKDGITYAVGEEHLQFQGSRVMAEKIASKYKDRIVIVVGDSTGNNKKDTAIDNTNYQIFNSFQNIKTRHFTNPPVVSRIINVNSRLFHNKLVIDPSCKNLIRDLDVGL